MIDKIVAIYTIMDDILLAIRHPEDKRREISDAELITTVITAAMYFGGTIETARACLRTTGLIPNMISKSRFNRRLHNIGDLLFDIFHQLGEAIKQISPTTEYLLDSFPIEICDNIRISRNKIIGDEAYRGYIASKKRYFYGVRVHLLTTASGIPVELAFLPGAAHDVRGMKALPLNLPPGSEIYGDSAYTDYSVEDTFKELEEVLLNPLRKKNSKRYDQPLDRLYKNQTRKRIETTFSQIVSWFPRHIHAVTFRGFLIKLTCFILGFTLSEAFLS
ncbi:IS982 family transposase [Candidatus Poribacteria bacterium]|nr:IS982 family transposase [Candidatus Poribacteria bacterium]